MGRNYEHLIGNKFALGSKPNKTAFKKGIIPWNKGKKGLHFSPKTEFKKGCKGINYLPVLSITKRIDKNKRTRQHIKYAAPNKWKYYAVYLWEFSFGKTKKGDIIHHLNGISNDDRIENLIALPRTDHPIFHNRWELKTLTTEQINFYKKRYEVSIL